eukprot:scaffold291310_cov31-Tisochrysis_lutea.AAC.4
MASIPEVATANMVCGINFRLTEPTRAVGHSAACSAELARCNATWPDEQAVSTLAHGPCKPRTKARRPQATEMVSPVIV